jgi:hypothetical protein
VYLVAGPALDTPPPSPYFLLASADRDEFAERLYRGEVDLEGLRSFLADCVLARGEMSQGLDRIAVEAETPVLDLLDAWRATAAPARLPYLDDISAFLPGDRPLFVTADAYEAACEASERFGLVSVCEECGLAEDAAAFLWTARAGKTVRSASSSRTTAACGRAAFTPSSSARRPHDPLLSLRDEAYAARHPGHGSRRASAGRRGRRGHPPAWGQCHRRRRGHRLRHAGGRALHVHAGRRGHDARAHGKAGRDGVRRLQRRSARGSPRDVLRARGRGVDGHLPVAAGGGRRQCLRPSLRGHSGNGGRADARPRPLGHHGAP